jgi:hypothetical protein
LVTVIHFALLLFKYQRGKHGSLVDVVRASVSKFGGSLKFRSGELVEFFGKNRFILLCFCSSTKEVSTDHWSMWYGGSVSKFGGSLKFGSGEFVEFLVKTEKIQT